MSANFLLGIRTDNFVILAADTNAYLFNAIKISKGQSKSKNLLYLWISGALLLFIDIINYCNILVTSREKNFFILMGIFQFEF